MIYCTRRPNMICIGSMKIPVCAMCNTPLIKQKYYFAFKCMCDEDVRMILNIDLDNFYLNVKYLNIDNYEYKN